MDIDRITQLRNERLTIDAKIAELTERKTQINDELVDTLGDGTWTCDDTRIIISRRKMLNVKKLATDYPATEYPTLYKLAIDNDRVKQEFAPAALEQYQTLSAPTVTFR